MATAVYSQTHQQLAQPSSSYTSDSAFDSVAPIQDDQPIATFFCRALYDYQSADDSSLTFRKGDVIEVLTRLETGWWDGLLGEDRGWFPSNYVTTISDEEADAAYAEAEMNALQNGITGNDDKSSAIYSAPSMSASTSASSSQLYTHDENGNWSDGDPTYRIDRGETDGPRAPSIDSNSQSSDFWVPQVTTDGQIYYVNTQTGQHSRDLPTEPEDELSDADFGPSVSSRLRSATGAGSIYGRVDARSLGIAQAGFGLPKRTGTPESWVRRLADDGLTYFYVNKLDGTVQWTPPEGSSTPRANGHHIPPVAPVATAAASQTNRLRSRSSASFLTRSRSGSVTGGVYSDDSDIEPTDRPAAKRANRQQVAHTPSSNLRQGSHVLSNTAASMLFDQTAAEKDALALQAELAPPAPDSLTERAQAARSAVTTVIDFIQTRGVVGHPDDQRALELRILDAVVAIRELLLISSPPYGQIPHTLYPQGTPVDRLTSASLTMSTQLKPTQRRVTATLSKLVLAALAAQYDASSLTPDAPARMEADAVELERAIGSFVLEVQRANTAIPPSERTLGKRRLHAEFLPTNIGLGLFGAGAAAMWKGFGWIKHPEGEGPARTLPDGIIADLRKGAAEADESISTLLSLLRTSVMEVSRVRTSATAATSSLQALLRTVSGIDLAKTIDIDGISSDGKATTSESYMQSVHKARQLVRTVEIAVQALHSDGALLFAAMQHYPQPRPASSGGSSDSLQGIATILRLNVSRVVEVFDALLLLGHEQADKGQNDYRGSIDWRASRLLSLDPSISQTLSSLSTFEEDRPNEADEQVDLDFVFTKAKTKPTLVTSNSEPLIPRQQLSQPPSQPDSADESSYGRLRVTGSAMASSGELRRSPSHRPNDSFDSTFSAQASSLGDSEGSVIEGNGPSKSPASAPTATKTPSRADKIIKMFGDVPSQILINIQTETLPWYLRPNYNEQEILIDPDGKVRGGTVPALVERLTAHENVPSILYTKTFLMTFRTFTDIDTLFDLLVQRFWIQPPENLTAADHEDWAKRKRDLIRTRVLNTFKSMIQDEDVLEKDDAYILERMKELVTNEEVSRMSAAKHIVALIERARSGENVRALTTTLSLDPTPPPIIPRVKGSVKAKLKLLDFDPIECARQLTIIECSLFMKIKASECLSRSRDQKPPNDNIAAAIETTNKIAHWVADTVLEKEDSRKRASIVKHFISIADRCRELRNFSSMIAIVSGLNSPHIRRLKRTWDQISQRFLSILGACEMTIDSQKNFNNYRQLLQRITPPCVPFIGVYLTTLTFIQDGAPNNLPGNLVNFRKRGKAAEVIQEIQKWQSKPFNFQRVDPIYDYIQEQLNKFNDTPDVSDIFWNRSLEREPREREDEKMARLLQETGFL